MVFFGDNGLLSPFWFYLLTRLEQLFEPFDLIEMLIEEKASLFSN
jgi:hypothetical protein